MTEPIDTTRINSLDLGWAAIGTLTSDQISVKDIGPQTFLVGGRGHGKNYAAKRARMKHELNAYLAADDEAARR